MHKFLRIFFLIFLSASACQQDSLEGRKLNPSLQLSQKNAFTYPGHLTRLFTDEKDSSIIISGTPFGALLKYTKEGKITDTLGTKGGKPWEFGSVWWYHPDYETGTYHVLDYQKDLIRQHLMTNDSMISASPFDQRSNVYGINAEDYLTTHYEENGEYSFAVYNTKNETYHDFHSIGADSLDIRLNGVRKDNVFVGEFVGNKDKTAIVYYCLNAGVFFIIDPINEKVSTHFGVRKMEIPKGRKIGSREVLDPTQLCFISGAVKDEDLYLLTTTKRTFYVGRDDQFYLDVYNLKNGNYKYSLPVPSTEEYAFPTEIKFLNNDLVVSFSYHNIVTYEIASISQ